MPARDRDIAMVFQSYALYPHLTVYDNIAFGLRLRKAPKDEIDQRVREAAHILGLEEFLERKPRALSGGQRQRVAMGRAIVRQPAAYLMDEPLSNLDAKLRVHMRAEIASLQNELGVTTIYVTHDQVEAMTMGDRVAVMRKGELQQVAPPQELYERPVNLFVGGFIGSPAMNLAEATIVRDNGATRRARSASTALALGARARRLRPELESYVDKRRRRRDPAREPRGRRARAGHARGSASCTGVVVLREPLGSEIVAHFTVDAPPALTEDVRELARDVGQESAVRAAVAPEEHETAWWAASARARASRAVTWWTSQWRRGALHFFDLETGLGIYGNTDNGIRATKHQPRGRSGRMRQRWLVFALVVGALAVVAAGCGAATTTVAGGVRAARTSRATSRPWRSGAARSRIRSRPSSTGSHELYPNVNVKYTSGGDNLAPLLSTAVTGREPARHRLHRPARPHEELRRAGRDPADRRPATSKIVDNFGQSVADVGSVDGKQYAVMFKGANKSTIWYNVADFEEAGVDPPETWEDLNAAAATLKAAGITPYSVGVDVGWPITDLFENVYIRAGGRGEVRPAHEPRDPVDGPVREGRADDHAGHRRRLGRPGRRDGRARSRPTCRRPSRTCSATPRRPRWSSSATSPRAS